MINLRWRRCQTRCLLVISVLQLSLCRLSGFSSTTKIISQKKSSLLFIVNWSVGGFEVFTMNAAPVDDVAFPWGRLSLCSPLWYVYTELQLSAWGGMYKNILTIRFQKSRFSPEKLQQLQHIFCYAYIFHLSSFNYQFLLYHTLMIGVNYYVLK